MAATAAAILGKSAVEFLLKFFKPLANQFYVRAKKLLNKDLTDYELQIFFAFEKEVQMKKVAKLLKKEQKQEKLRQYKDAQSKKS
jgi:N12 class adenine-specific DNA methylase